MVASGSIETLAVGDDERRPPPRPWGTYAGVALVLAACVATLWPSRAHRRPQPAEVTTAATLRYRGVEVDVPSTWLSRRLEACPSRDVAQVAPLRDLRAGACPKGHRRTVVLLSPYDADRPPQDSVGEGEDGRTYASRVVPQRGVVLSVATYDSAFASELLAGLRTLRQGDIVGGCPAAALKLPVQREKLAIAVAHPERVRGATVCAYAGAWLGGVATYDAAAARRLVADFGGVGAPPDRSACREQDVTGTRTHGWLTYLDTTPGTTALLVLQRCLGEPGGTLLVTGEASSATTPELWRRLAAVGDDHGLTPTYP